jgi:molybdopterin converting factor small subunit
MKVRVQYTAQLRTAIGRAADEVELPAGSSVAALLAHLQEKLDGAGSHLLTGRGDTQHGLLVVVNNVAVCSSRVAITELCAGDAILLLPPIAGG